MSSDGLKQKFVDKLKGRNPANNPSSGISEERWGSSFVAVSATFDVLRVCSVPVDTRLRLKTRGGLLFFLIPFVQAFDDLITNTYFGSTG
jgi:hypothetical protein